MTQRKKIFFGALITAGIAIITYLTGYVHDQALLGVVTAVNGVLAALQIFIQSRPSA